MQHITGHKDPPLSLPCLRLLVPPLRLVSAAMWHTVQHRLVAKYGLLDDFVTLMTEIVPELLNHRQRTLLSLGLRTQLILELCYQEPTIDPQIIQPHLDRLQTLTSLWNAETNDTEHGLYGSDILGLIEMLMKDQDERQQFFQDVFPVKFGPKYNEAIQMLVWKFLSQLEKLLTVPNCQQVKCMLNEVPSVLEECMESLSQAQELKSLLAYQKDLCQLDDNENLTAGESICTALSLPPMETVSTAHEETVLKANVLTDFMDSFSKEFIVESAALEKESVVAGLATEEKEEERHTVPKNFENQSSLISDETVEEQLACTIQHFGSLNSDNVESDSCAVEVQVGYNVEITAEGIGLTENKASAESVPTVMETREADITAFNNYSNSCGSSSVQVEKCTQKGSDVINSGQMKNIVTSNMILSPILYTPTVQVLRLEPIIAASPRPVRQNRGLNMKAILMVTSENEQSKSSPQDSSISKTCPTCGKTYSRASDMRRHQRTHTGERPFQCPQCKKLFQYQYDLKRHELNVCQIAVLQVEKIPKTAEGKIPNLSQGEVIDPVIGLYQCSNCDSIFKSAQRLRTHEKACRMSQRQGECISEEGVPPTMEQKDPWPLGHIGQLTDTKELNPSLLENKNDVTAHKENPAEGEEPEVTARTPHGQTSKRPHECKLCSKTFAYPSLMFKHMETHSEERAHHCSACNKAYKCTASLKRHSEGCKGSSVNFDKEDQQMTNKLFRASKAPTANELVESSSQESISCAHREPNIPGTTKLNEMNGVTSCSLCGAAVTGSMKCHMRSHCYPCPYCEVKFKFNDLRRHITACNAKTNDHRQAEALKEFRRLLRKCKVRDNPLYCAECNRSFPDMARFQTHNLRHKPRSCTKCDETFSDFKGLNQHYVDAHDFSGPFPCSFCERSYTDLRGLIRHERVHTGDLPFQCPKCPKAFSYASALKLHDRTHTKEAPYLCWDCGKGCKSNAALRIHRLCCHSSTQEKCFSCEHCGKAYALKRSLDLHVAKIHAGVRYPCSHCGKLFRSSSSLTRHDLTHTQERPYSCKECGKSFRSTSELKIHVRYHTGERPFTCQECGKGFVQSYYLTAHMRMHTGEKPYKCNTCDKYFKSGGILKRHQMTHTGEKPYKCSICERAFSRPELVKVHVKKSH